MTGTDVQLTFLIDNEKPLEENAVNTTSDKEILDTVLTLRGHKITLRQAIAEGIVKGRFDPGSGAAEVQDVDPDWFVEKPRRRKPA